MPPWPKDLFIGFICSFLIILIIALPIKYYEPTKSFSNPGTSKPVTKSPINVHNNNSSKSPTSIPTPIPTPTPTPTPTSLEGTIFPTSQPATKPPTIITNLEKCTPVKNGSIGDCCHWNNTCRSNVCANTHQSVGTSIHYTCLPNNLGPQARCYNDESCKSESCEYDFSRDYFVCN